MVTLYSNLSKDFKHLNILKGTLGPSLILGFRGSGVQES